MTREKLEYTIRAACEVVGDAELWVFGSRASSGNIPMRRMNYACQSNLTWIRRTGPTWSITSMGSWGRVAVSSDPRFLRPWSLDRDGYSAPGLASADEDGVKPERVHDLGANKLAAFRDKDRGFVRLLLRERLVDPNRLVRLINLLPLSDDQRTMLRKWVNGTERELTLARLK